MGNEGTEKVRVKEKGEGGEKKNMATQPRVV